MCMGLGVKGWGLGIGGGSGRRGEGRWGGEKDGVMGDERDGGGGESVHWVSRRLPEGGIGFGVKTEPRQPKNELRN